MLQEKRFRLSLTLTPKEMPAKVINTLQKQEKAKNLVQLIFQEGL